MKIQSYTIQTNSMPPMCKSPSAWGRIKNKNEAVPLVFFKKPAWISEKDFQMIISSIQLYIPPEYEFTNKENSRFQKE
jgi:hypothetical protein